MEEAGADGAAPGRPVGGAAEQLAVTAGPAASTAGGQHPAASAAGGP